jgi:hypothetical protein
MAGLIISAYDASNNQSIDNVYHLNSGISATDPDNGVVNGTPTNLNDRIFQDVAGTFSNRTNSYQSQTDTPMNFFGTQCTGWDAFGPEDIDTNQIGNGYVLDCGPTGNATHFWFTNLRPNPIGDGANGQNGYWSISVNGPSGSYSIPHYTEGSSNYGSNYFTVTNGQNTFVQMIWHPITWHLSGDTKVNGVDPSSGNATQSNPLKVNPGTKINFSHSVSSSGSTASYSWSVVSGSVPGGKPAGTAPPDPSGVTDGYSIPANTPDGTLYCEHIQYTNPNGPADQSIGSSQAACAVVSSGPTHGQTQGACTHLTASVTGNYFNQSKRAHVVISGTNHDVDENIPNDGGAGKTNTDMITRNYNYQPLHNSITVTVTTQYLTNGTNPHWQDLDTQYIRTTAQPCFSATCNITSVTGDGPGGVVLAGGTMHVSGTYTNTSPPPDYLTLWNPVMQYAANGQDYPAGGIVTQALGGGTYGFSFDVGNTDSGPNYDTLTFTPVYFNNQAIGSACSGVGTGGGGGSIPTYQHFTASAEPHAQLGPTREDAQYALCYTRLEISGTSHPVNLSVSSTFTKNGGNVIGPINGGTYTSAGDGVWMYTIGSPPPGAICANTVPNGTDQYCANITLNYTDGYVDPNNNVYDGTGGRTGPPDCDHEDNEPYFKVQGAGAAADLKDVEKANASGTLTCTPPAGKTGLLAGWNDNADNGADRGAGSQLSSIALLKITGFASGQTSIFRKSPVPGVDLSFANSGNDATGAAIVPATDAESPALGGSYGAQAKCVVPPQPDTSVAQTLTPGSLNLNGGDTTGVGVAKNYKGDLTLSSSRVLSGNTSVFVNGNVYINSNLQLNQAGWGISSTGKTTVPSFTLTATGNIYISPNVTQLDGIYASSGTIYTCGQISPVAYAPMPAAQLYDSCHNQLLFTGSVMADQVKMMRTFGSLRDEKAVTGTTTATVTNNDGAVPFNRYYCGSGNPPGSVPYPSTHFYQMQNGPVPGNCGLEGPIGDVLPTQTGGSTPLWYVNGSNGNDWLYTTSYGEAQQDGGRPCAGGCNPAVAGYVFTYPASGTVPLYGIFNGDTDSTSTHFYTTSYAEYVGACNTVTSGGGGICLGPVAYIYTTAGQGATTSTVTVPTPLGPNLTPACSHPGTRVVAYTCAAEVIQFSPELYLGNQTIDKDSDGALQYDSITSLPPVL